MVELRVHRIGDALGVALPEEVVARLGLADGARLYLVEAPEGGYRLIADTPGFETKMAKAGDIIDRYRNTLHVLEAGTKPASER